MLRLLQIELIKLWNSKSSRILIITYFILLTFLSLISAIRIKIGSIDFLLADQGIFNFPFIWHFNTYIAIHFKLFLAIIIVSMIASEYSNKTLKQNLIDGLSKREFILSKFLTILLFAIISTLVVFVISLILGGIYSVYDEIGIIFSDMEYLIAYFLNLVGFFSICLFFAVLTRKSAFALGFLVIWFIGESIFSAILNYKLESLKFLVDFFPLQAISNLLKEPFTRLSAIKMAVEQVAQGFHKDYTLQLQDAVTVMGWTVIFVTLSYYLIKRRDL
ncbi:ABC transporter permease [Capnocytophaga canimorsus]|uniref:ABC transporter permease n=1 Tax=Capnocytophaga canimorsus TaxID=28188 RepID=UPI000F4DA58B|nr:ABC transporter permease subunit [Capnocytophaga canimorsus]AYW36460.1 ABC transporter permease [Capnocytophaga canimorsus]